MNNITPEQKKERLKNAAMGFMIGIGIATLIWNMIYTKKVGKLEAKIFKLEGWQ